MLRAQATAGGGVVATAVREAESDGQQSIAVGVVIGSLRVCFLERHVSSLEARFACDHRPPGG